MKCEKCGARMKMDESLAYLSNPPQYNFKCPECDHVEIGTSDKDDCVDEKDGGEIYIMALHSKHI